MDIPVTTTPIGCDMTNACYVGPERLMEYQRPFSQALIGRERTTGGIRFQFRGR